MPNAVLHFATFASPTLLFKKVQVMTKAITISFLKTHQNIRKKDKLPATAAEHPQNLRIQIHKKSQFLSVYPQLTDLKFQIRNLQYIFPTQCDDFFLNKNLEMLKLFVRCELSRLPL